MSNRISVYLEAPPLPPKNPARHTTVSRPVSRGANYWTQEDEVVTTQRPCLYPLVSLARGMFGLPKALKS